MLLLGAGAAPADAGSSTNTAPPIGLLLLTKSTSGPPAGFLLLITKAS